MRRETKTWAGRLAAVVVVVVVLAYVPYHVYVRSGLKHTIVLRRDLIALHAHNQELAAENQRLAREAEALRTDPAAIERVARDELGWVRAGEVVVDLSPRPDVAAERPVARAAGRRAARGAVKKLKLKNRTVGERVGYLAGRLTRATLAFAVCGVVLVLLWCGWFPDLRAPGADLRRVAAATVLTALLAFKIAARVRTSERRRTPRREAISDAELGMLLLTTIYLLLAFWGGVGSPVYPLVYAVVSFLVTFHRLVVGLPLAATAIGFEAVLCFGPGAPPDAAGLFAGARRLHRRVRAPQRRLPARRGGAPAPRAPPARRRRGHGDARGRARLPPDLDGAVRREPRAHARRGAGEAVAGIDPDDPPAALLQPGSAAGRAAACRPARCSGWTRRASG